MITLADIWFVLIGVLLVGYAVLGAKKPTAFGTIVGALFIGVLLYGLTRLQMAYYTQDLIKGLVIFVALLISFSLRRRRRRAPAVAPPTADTADAGVRA